MSLNNYIPRYLPAGHYDYDFLYKHNLITEHKSMTTISIASQPFTIPTRYTAGHTCTAAEAAILQAQMVVRLRKAMQDEVAEVAPFDATGPTSLKLQRKLVDLYTNFSFSAHDGVAAEALAIALAIVKNSLKSQHKNLSQYSKSALTTEAEKVLAGPKRESIMALAKTRVTEIQRLAAEELKRVETA